MAFLFILELGIMLQNDIPASMKQQYYRVTVVFSKSGILACECDCKAGSKGLDKVVCVHVLPVLMQFVVFMFEDLGENLLIEFCNRWNATLEEKLSSHLDEIREYIVHIMDSIGCTSDETNKAKLSPTIKGMLDSFCVGTEKKKNIPLPPKDDELIPLSQYLSVSTSKSLKKLLTKKRKTDLSPATLLTTRKTKSSRKFPSDPTILKKNKNLVSVLQSLVCDFCKVPTNTTSHVCIHGMLDGPRVVEGTTTRVCGLASCIGCKEKYKLEEEEHRTSCPIHCKARTMKPADHPLLEKIDDAEDEVQVEEGEEPPPEQIPKDSTFLPDYERIKYAIDGIGSLYVVKNTNDNQEVDISSYPGIKILGMRSSAIIKTANRRQKYIENETKSMYKKMRDLMKMADKRVKIRKKKKSIVTEKNTVQENEVANLEEVANDIVINDNVISSQSSSTSPTPISNIALSAIFNQENTTSTSSSSTSTPISNFASSATLHQNNNSTSSQPSSSTSIFISNSTSLSQPSSQSSSQSSSSNTSSTSNFTSSKFYQITSTTRNRRRRFILPTTTSRNIQTSAAVTVEEPTFELRRSRKKTDRKFSFKCCFPNCHNNNNAPGVSFTKVMKEPVAKADMTKPRNLRNFHRKLNHHTLLISRCGLKNKKWTQNTRFCTQHTTETVRLKKKINICGAVEEIVFEYKNIPTGTGVQTEPQTLSVFDRRAVTDWKQFENKKLDKHGTEATEEIMQYKNKWLSCYSPETLAKKHGISQRAREEINLPVYQMGETSSTIQKMIKKDDDKVSKRKKSSIITNNILRLEDDPSSFTSSSSTKQQTIKRRKTRKSPNNNISTPAVTPMSETCDEIKRRTGFLSEEVMMRFIIIVCNADTTFIEETISNELTWFEEWFLYFEVLWLRSHTRWQDAAKIFNTTQISVLRQVFDSKCQTVLACRSSWPIYAFHHEDVHLRKDKWNLKYDEYKRIVQWDDTNVPFTFKPSRADNQRLTYSSYYGMNCAKGGVFLQLCGWLGVEKLWVGATSDSHYQIHNKIFEKQRDFAAKDLYKGKHIPFTNVFDKGYRLTLEAHRAGEQECIQPIFAKSDRRFARDETVVSASVAADRSGNERAVNMAKKSGYIKRGLTPAGSPERLNNAWLAWSFQVNFMYNTVL